MRNKKEYEHDSQTFTADAYKVKGYAGIAWRILGWEVDWQDIEFKDDCHNCNGTGQVENEDGEVDSCSDCDGNGQLVFTEQEQCQTGRVVARMVGDDTHFAFDLDEITPIAREEYCGECGQIGCQHDGLDRSEEIC